MIIILLSLLGAIWGGLLARKRGGNRLDIAQYAAVLAIIGALLGMIVTILLARTL